GRAQKSEGNGQGREAGGRQAGAGRRPGRRRRLPQRQRDRAHVQDLQARCDEPAAAGRHPYRTLQLPLHR
ncbi:hypothetical protein LTR94_038045, partial [Friedmanniomyces endolithicus]